MQLYGNDNNISRHCASGHAQAKTYELEDYIKGSCLID